MKEKIEVELDRDVWERLQGLAVPLVDDESSVLRRILGDWEQRGYVKEQTVTDAGASHPPQPRRPDRGSETPEYFRSTRGVQIPFGKLRASYKPRGKQRMSFEAVVTVSGIEFAGETYDDPSPAGVRAKELAGASGQATATNGWRFWEYYDKKMGVWTSIGSLRGR